MFRRLKRLMALTSDDSYSLKGKDLSGNPVTNKAYEDSKPDGKAVFMPDGTEEEALEQQRNELGWGMFGKFGKKKKDGR